VHLETRLGWPTVIMVLLAIDVASAHEEPVQAVATSADGATATSIHPPEDDRSPAWCGWLDTPETGIQGDVPLADQASGRAQQGYNCGLAVVGYNNLGGASGSDVTGVDHCAYVKVSGAGGGIRVLDVSDPAAPVVVQTLPLTVTSENIYARKAPDRSLLVAGGAPSAPGQPIPAYVWDVEDCTNPVLLGTVGFPGLSPGDPAVQSQIHNIELTPDGKRIYGSLPMQVADISNLADPSTWTVQSFQCELAAQAPLGFSGFLFSQARFAVNHPECANLLGHEFEFNNTGTRMYIGGQMSGTSATLLDPLHRPWHTELQLRVVDITVWPPQIIGVVEPASGHGVRRATIGGKPYLLNSNENVNPDFRTVNGCHTEKDLIRGAAQAFLTDIGDETAPQVVSELELAINDEANCAAQLESRVRASIHYAELDDPDRTHFAMVSMGNAGLRVFDVRQPSQPGEVAYWNPGMLLLPSGSPGFDATSWHPRYVTLEVPCGRSSRNKCEASYILLTSRLGFWVLEIEPLTRLRLGLPLNLITTKYPFGRPARPADL
jgi:hypothetical protein